MAWPWLVGNSVLDQRISSQGCWTRPRLCNNFVQYGSHMQLFKIQFLNHTATSKVFHSHFWPVATILDSTHIEYFHLPRQGYWTVLFYRISCKVSQLNLSGKKIIFRQYILCLEYFSPADHCVAMSWHRKLLVETENFDECMIKHNYYYIHWFSPSYYLKTDNKPDQSKVPIKTRLTLPWASIILNNNHIFK